MKIIKSSPGLLIKSFSVISETNKETPVHSVQIHFNFPALN